MKYTFIQFLAARESEFYKDQFPHFNFDNPDPSWIDHFNKEESLNLVHLGDCTKFPSACFLCGLEDDLRDYRHYYFNEEQWRKDNLI